MIPSNFLGADLSLSNVTRIGVYAYGMDQCAHRFSQDWIEAYCTVHKLLISLLELLPGTHQTLIGKISLQLPHFNTELLTSRMTNSGEYIFFLGIFFPNM